MVKPSAKQIGELGLTANSALMKVYPADFSMYLQVLKDVASAWMAYDYFDLVTSRYYDT